MRFSAAIDEYIRDLQSQGRINSLPSVRAYRGTLEKHCDDVRNRDPRYVGRSDVKRTLERWSNPNTQRKNRSILVSFYDWTMEEGLRRDNPARQTRRPKARKPDVYRLSRDEVVALLGAARGQRERRALYLGFFLGLRSKELRGLQGRHFERAGYVWVSSDIAKGQRARTIPVPRELEPIVADICRTTASHEYVLPAQRWRDPGVNRETVDLREHPMSAKALWELVGRVGVRAGIAAHIHPHLMRHAYAHHVYQDAGARPTQFLLGHANLATTQVYLSEPTPEELRGAVAAFTYGVIIERPFYPTQDDPTNPVEARTGIEPVYTALQAAA